MFYYLSGTLALRDTYTCVIDCGGVGYKLTVSLLTSDSLSDKVGKTVKLYTYLAVREDGIELFGFNTPEEKNCFDLLTSVSGVGPKAAINILSILSPDRLVMAICTEDAKSISKAQNIGAKTAARIIVDLKDKVAKNMLFSDNSEGISHPDTVAVSSGALSEATEALMALGYDKSTVLSVLKSVDVKEQNSGAIIKAALKKLARN
jgi:Holliday junction DNA helicase RuvA